MLVRVFTIFFVFQWAIFCDFAVIDRPPSDKISPQFDDPFPQKSTHQDTRLLELQYTAAVISANHGTMDMAAIPFPFGDVFSSIPTLFDKKSAKSNLNEVLESSDIEKSLPAIEEAIFTMAPFPMNFIFKWWMAFRGFATHFPLSWEKEMEPVNREKPEMVFGGASAMAMSLLPFPYKFLADFRKLNNSMREREVKNMLIDSYDEAGIDVEEADRILAGMVAPWLPWPHNKLISLVLPFRSRQHLLSFGGSPYSMNKDPLALVEWEKAMGAIRKEEPGRSGRGLLGLFGLSPLQFFPMLTPLNLFGKSFNSSGPRPMTLQIFLPENQTFKFSTGNTQQTVVNVTVNSTETEKKPAAEPGYDVDLSYYYKVYPKPSTPHTTFNPVAYNADVDRRVSAALMTFHNTTETTTEPMTEETEVPSGLGETDVPSGVGETEVPSSEGVGTTVGPDTYSD